MGYGKKQVRKLYNVCVYIYIRVCVCIHVMILFFIKLKIMQKQNLSIYLQDGVGVGRSSNNSVGNFCGLYLSSRCASNYYHVS